MAVYKEEKTNTWRVLYRYTDWNGERKQSQKRGFKTKREAQAWEREQLNKLGGDLDMSFKSFVQHYTEDMQARIKENTWATKEHIIQTKLMPYFGKLKMCNITAQQIINWQNELINYKGDNGKPYSPVYLKTIHNQLSAIFNHAVRYYNLKENPCQKAGSMGKKKNREMLFWTKEEYLKFADAMMDNTNANLYRENERLSNINDHLTDENTTLRAENKDFKLLRKVFGSQQIDALISQAKEQEQQRKHTKQPSNQRTKRIRNNDFER